jgi:hypothetical protein
MRSGKTEANERMRSELGELYGAAEKVLGELKVPKAELTVFQ